MENTPIGFINGDAIVSVEEYPATYVVTCASGAVPTVPKNETNHNYHGVQDWIKSGGAVTLAPTE